jgi:hypothetical protein
MLSNLIQYNSPRGGPELITINQMYFATLRQCLPARLAQFPSVCDPMRCAAE